MNIEKLLSFRRLSVCSLLFSVVTMQPAQAQDTGTQLTATAKLCLDKFCLGDPISNFGGVKSLRYISPFLPDSGVPIVKSLPPLPALNCDGKTYSVITSDQNPRSKSFFHLEIAPFPDFQKPGINEYYRVIKVSTYFPEIAKTDVDPLAERVFARAGLVGEKSPFFNLFIWRPKKSFAFGGLPVENISISAGTTYLTLMMNSVHFSSHIKSQPGCTKAAPKL